MLQRPELTPTGNGKGDGGDDGGGDGDSTGDGDDGGGGDGGGGRDGDDGGGGGLVAKSCPTLWHPMDCSLTGSSVHGILQARILEWVAISFSRGSS